MDEKSEKIALFRYALVAPLVLLYQGWTYHVFRGRVGGKGLTGATETPTA